MRYVVAVAETRSFTRAAERCLVVQSALSHQIAKLERELGVQLFARSSRRVEVTQAGEAFVAAARQSLDAAERAVAGAAAAMGEVRGRLAVGVIPTVAAVDVPELLQRFRARHPKVRISLEVAASDELAARVMRGALDAAFVGLEQSVPPPARVAARELARDRLRAVLPVEHPLASRKRVRLADLADETFVDFAAGTPGRAQSDRAFAAAGVVRSVDFEVSAADLMEQMVRRGLGIALLPSTYELRLPELVSVAVTDGPHRVEHLLWSGFHPSPAAQAFIDLVG